MRRGLLQALALGNGPMKWGQRQFLVPDALAFTLALLRPTASVENENWRIASTSSEGKLCAVVTQTPWVLAPSRA